MEIRSRPIATGRNAPAHEHVRIQNAVSSGVRPRSASTMEPAHAPNATVSSRKLRLAGTPRVDGENGQAQQQIAHHRDDGEMIGRLHGQAVQSRNYSAETGPNTTQVFPPPWPWALSRMRRGLDRRAGPWM